MPNVKFVVFEDVDIIINEEEENVNCGEVLKIERFCLQTEKKIVIINVWVSYTLNCQASNYDSDTG